MNTRYPIFLAGVMLVLVSCAPAEPQVTLAPNVVVLPEADVSSATSSRMVVDTEKTISAGQIIVSDEGDGVLRKISTVKEVSPSQVGSQIVRKTYELTTTDASLEDAIVEATATLDPPELKLDDESVVQRLAGVEVQAVSGKITLKNVTFIVAPGVTVNLNGSIQQSIDPKFMLKFVGGKVSLFEAGVSGSLGASLQAKITTTGRATFAAGVEQQIVRFAPIRSTFAVGAIPVVVILEPRVVAGASAGADKAITLNAGIAPTLNFNTGVRYSPTGGWGNLYSGSPTFSAKLNPTFNYEVPGGGQGEVYAKVVIDVKFYGIVGPSLEVKPLAKLAINAATPNQANVTGGLNAASKVVAGFKVMGKGMENEYPLKSVESLERYTCTTTSCTATN